MDRSLRRTLVLEELYSSIKTSSLRASIYSHSLNNRKLLSCSKRSCITAESSWNSQKPRVQRQKAREFPKNLEYNDKKLGNFSETSSTTAKSSRISQKPRVQRQKAQEFLRNLEYNGKKLENFSKTSSTTAKSSRIFGYFFYFSYIAHTSLLLQLSTTAFTHVNPTTFVVTRQ